MKYYAKLRNTWSPKNRKCAAIIDYARETDGTLLPSDEALEQFANRVKLAVDQVNMKFKQGFNLEFNLNQFMPGSWTIVVNECFYMSIHPVKHEFPDFNQQPATL